MKLQKKESFSNDRFRLYHHGNNKWSVKNENNMWWCGSDEWVNEGSSYWNIDGDCINTIFTWDELKKFIEEKFSTYL